MRLPNQVRFFFNNYKVDFLFQFQTCGVASFSFLVDFNFTLNFKLALGESTLQLCLTS